MMLTRCPVPPSSTETERSLSGTLPRLRSHGEDPGIYYHPTHINVKPSLYWAEQFARAGFIPDFESYDRFARMPGTPGLNGRNFYMHYADQWTIAAYLKP